LPLLNVAVNEDGLRYLACLLKHFQVIFLSVIGLGRVQNVLEV